MFLPRRTSFWRSFRHRLTTCLILAAYLATAVGFPLPASAGKDHSIAFPCMDHPCGCQTAEQCWRECCCFTPEEKFAWAEAHGVTPPDYAARPAAQGWQTARLRDQETVPAQAACAKCARCAARTEVANGGAKRACCAGDGKASANKQPARSGWVLGWAALRCRGSSTSWATAGTVLPPPPPLTWNPYWSVTDRVSYADASVHPLPSPPPEHPPRTSRV